MQVQNQEGNYPLRWDKTRVALERLEHSQYLVKYDGSGQVLLRARGYLKKILPSTRGQMWPEMPIRGKQVVDEQDVQPL